MESKGEEKMNENLKREIQCGKGDKIGKGVKGEMGQEKGRKKGV